MVPPDPERYPGHAEDGQTGEDDGDGEERDVVGFDAQFDLEPTPLGPQPGGAYGYDVPLLPQAQLEEVSVSGVEAVDSVGVHLKSDVDVFVLLDDLVGVAPLHLENVSPSGGERTGGVPAKGDERGSHGDGEDLDVLRLKQNGKRSHKLIARSLVRSSVGFICF